MSEQSEGYITRLVNALSEAYNLPPEFLLTVPLKAIMCLAEVWSEYNKWYEEQNKQRANHS